MTPEQNKQNNKHTNLQNSCLHLLQSLHPCLATNTLPSPKIWKQAGSQIPLIPFCILRSQEKSDQAQTFMSPFPSNNSIFFSLKSIKTIKTKAPKGRAPQAGLKLLLQCCCLIAAAKPAQQKKRGKSEVSCSKFNLKYLQASELYFSFPTFSCCSSTVAGSQCERLAKAALPQIASS